MTRPRPRRRQHRGRYLRHRKYGDGSVGAELKLPALVGGQVLAVLDKLTDQRFREQRAAGVHEPREAYAADALCQGLGVAPSADPDRARQDAPAGPTYTTGRPAPDGQHDPSASPDHTAEDGLDAEHDANPPPNSDTEPGRRVEGGAITDDDAGGGPQVSVRSELVVVVDADTLRNGRVGAGGVCEIPGVGPVPVEAAQELLGEADVDLVIRDGHDVVHVTCGGRRLSKAMRRAMLVQGGWECRRQRVAPGRRTRPDAGRRPPRRCRRRTCP